MYIIVLKRHISVTFVTIIKVFYKKNINSMQIIAKMYDQYINNCTKMFEQYINNCAQMYYKITDHTFLYNYLYRVSQEESTIFWEIILSVILSKNVYTNKCPIPNGFRDRAI